MVYFDFEGTHDLSSCQELQDPFGSFLEPWNLSILLGNSDEN